MKYQNVNYLHSNIVIIDFSLIKDYVGIYL